MVRMYIYFTIHTCIHNIILSLRYIFSDENATEVVVPNESIFCPRDKVNLSCNVRNSNSSIIQLSDDRNNKSLEVHCSNIGSKNRLIHTTFDNDNIMPIINTSFSDNTGDGTSLLNCTVSLLGADQLNGSEFNVSCLNPEIGVQADKTTQIRGKCANEYNNYMHTWKNYG